MISKAAIRTAARIARFSIVTRPGLVQAEADHILLDETDDISRAGGRRASRRAVRRARSAPGVRTRSRSAQSGSDDQAQEITVLDTPRPGRPRRERASSH